MAREVAAGTPNRSPGYVVPPARSPYLRLSLIVAAVLLVIVPAVYLIGRQEVASPGPVGAHHANFEGQCVACHQVGHAVEPIRCERCHDAGGVDRLTSQAHVLLGSANPRKAAAAPDTACVDCHTDHRGRDADMQLVDDRRCAACHQFSTLGRHPEFAAVKARKQTGVGLNFGHERHIAEVAKQLGKRCEACHEMGSNLTAFQPINFQRHCAACHTTDGRVNGETEAIPDDLLALAGLPAGIALPEKDDQGRRQSIFRKFDHRDRWVLFNAQRLRRMIDADGIESETAGLQARVDYLTRQVATPPLGTLDRAALEATRDALKRDIASLDQRLARSSDANGDVQELQALALAIKPLADQLQGLAEQPAGAGAWPTVAAPPTAVSEPSGAFVDARRKELNDSLDAIALRDPRLADRVAALKKRAGALAPSSIGQAPAEPLGRQLRGLDDVLAAVRATGDADAVQTVAEISAIRADVESRVAGGLSPNEFETRRRELLSLLTAIGKRGLPADRVDALRRRVLALRSGTFSGESLRDEQARLTKALVRVELELEFKAGGHAPAASAVTTDSPQQLRELVDRANARLATLNDDQHVEMAATPDEVSGVKDALANLLGPCLKCHVLEGARIAPVNPALTVFTHARFNHKPHVEQADCLTCHKAVQTSTRATDISVPDAASCTTCHRSSRSRADCASCHDYHPRSVAALLGAM